MTTDLKKSNPPAVNSEVRCDSDPIASLVEMFVQVVQAGRIAKGQCPAMRPVFGKPHGVASGLFRINPDLPNDLKVGLFAGIEYPAWVRFSSDTLPMKGDYKTTVGLAIKLFNAPIPKIFGQSEDTTFDFIFQNSDVFFVDDASEMCAFTKAGVIDGDYGPYLKAHPKTARILDEMARPVASALATDYWSAVPFAFGRGRYVKYKLSPTIAVEPILNEPSNPTYLGADLATRLKSEDAYFRFSIQFQIDQITMPLDQATVRWEESISLPIHVADLILPRQDIPVRDHVAYGENLSWNIWRVTEDHKPEGTIAEARRVVYAASAKLRHDVNGVPDGEPTDAKPSIPPTNCTDSTIVRAAIHPGIGIARIGDSPQEFYVGPEVNDPEIEEPSFYRDSAGALKRQAARFHIYGYNSTGQIVRELTAESADIKWAVHLANKKAQWFQFQAALDIPEADAMSVPLRNSDVPKTARQTLAIDPGPRDIKGKSVYGGKAHMFDTGMFKGTVVPLGEIRTDDSGCLLVLGGTGKSASPSNAPVFSPADPNSFNNANDWYDDISDGPVTASVSVNGQQIPVEPAWVVVAPPNYAPNIVGWRTLYELLVDVYVQCGWMTMPQQVSFSNDILPTLRRLSNLQWVNKGFATMYGKGGPMDFEDDAFIQKLAHTPDPTTKLDPFSELREIIFNSFRPFDSKVKEPPSWPHVWPWIYGDAYGSFAADSPGNNLALPCVRETLLKRWVEGDFVNDWPQKSLPAASLADIPLAEQPATLDKAALHFCLADAFHPGCEMTWPMRHASMYTKPFRIRHRELGDVDPGYGSALNQRIALKPGGPLYAQGPGDISRWMALPWQGDTAFCRSGYDVEYDPYLPTFWPARVPNQVLTEEDYAIVMNSALARDARLSAFNNRSNWLRAVMKGSAPDVMMTMIAHFGAMGIVEARPGLKDDPDFPEMMFVESLAASRLKQAAMDVTLLMSAPSHPLTRAERAGWESQDQLEEFRTIRVRHQ